MSKHPSHEDNLVALRRIEGQVRGVQRMVENNKYCIDILNQIYAIKGALVRVEEKILEKFYGIPMRDIKRSKGSVSSQSTRASHSSLNDE